MNKLYYPTDLFLPIANTLCNELAPISCNMEACLLNFCYKNNADMQQSIKTLSVLDFTDAYHKSIL